MPVIARSIMETRREQAFPILDLPQSSGCAGSARSSATGPARLWSGIGEVGRGLAALLAGGRSVKATKPELHVACSINNLARSGNSDGSFRALLHHDKSRNRKGRQRSRAARQKPSSREVAAMPKPGEMPVREVAGKACLKETGADSTPVKPALVA
jgi:hypothetical protein